MFSIRHRLLILQCATVLATTIFLGALSYSLFIPVVFKLQQQGLQHVSREASKDISIYLQNLSEQLESLDLEGFHQKYGDLPLEELFVRHFSNLSDSFPLISYLDKDNNETVRLVNSRPSEYFFDLKKNPLVKAAVAEPNKVQIGLTRSAPGFDHPSLQLAISKVGYFGDEFFGTLLITIPTAELQEIMKAIPIHREQGYISLVDERQVLLSENEGPLFKKLSSPIPEEPGRFLFLGEDMFIAAQPVEHTSWQVVSALPYSVFSNELQNLKIMAGLTCLMVTLLSVGLSTRLVRHLTRNIELLVDHIEKIGAGDYDHHVELYQDQDFEKLGEAINTMTQDLARHRNSQESLQQIQESIIDPLLIADQQGHIKQVNHATMELLGCEERNLIGKPLADLFPDPPELLTEASFASALLRKRVNNVETYVEGCNGKRIAVLFSSSPVPGRNIEMGIVGIMKNIDELVNARIAREHALREAEDAHRRIDALLKSVADGLIVTNLSGRVLMHNQPAEELLGDQESPNFQRLLQALPEASTSCQMRPFDISIPADNNSKCRIVQVHSSPVLDHRGSHTGMVSMLRDVTRERALEQIKNEFFNTAANELTSPLTSIVGYSELLLDREIEGNFSYDQKRDFVEEILSRSESLAKIIDDLHNISRLESGQQIPLEQQALDPKPLLEKIVRQTQNLNSNRRFEVELESTGEMQVMLDERQMQKVMENLLSNAIKFSPETSPIKIVGRVENNDYEVKIIDQGIGMSQFQLERIFDKFYRSDNNTAPKVGIGIGMSIVQQIIESHQGSIQVESQPNSGTTVTLLLPLVNA
ncbi:PAS domain S-box-containing protein [Malonomonas rubra DSM 5091]|uniref:histidine kinase n=1 Tax=Malonomonas rubra DSM 5091 TaxID=1122189 RepID=A0A1M6LP62_MALRU|nr:ATP-binding protein [Malonomonas rubra]SHJ72978.1 PAS domain S-box-containing protein [Malonomonas rubra DSM 5091]